MPKASYVPTLDGWRAIALLAVFFSHGVDRKLYPCSDQVGHLGVELFFGISGFLITYHMVEEWRRTGGVSLSRFYVRRAFRILPIALVFLATISLLGHIGVISLAGSRIPQALFFASNYTRTDWAQPGSWYTAQFWSLCVEEHFYLIWPALLVLVGLHRARWVAPALAGSLMVWHILDERFDFVANAFHAPYLSHNHFRTDYEAYVLMLGCTLALWLGHQPWDRKALRGCTTWIALALCAFVGFGSFSPAFRHAENFVAISLVLLIAITITDSESLIGRFLDMKPLAMIGRLSYSLYIWQQLFLLRDYAPLSFQREPWNLVSILACSYVSYHAVEQPAIKVGRELIARSLAKEKTELITL